MDIDIIDITKDGVTEQFYHCNSCGNEWPVNQDSTIESNDEA